jgi:hypothetical protein
MRITTFLSVLAASLVVAAVPMTAAAGVTLGANMGSARVNDGDFESDDTGWKAHIGGNVSDIIGAEIGYIDFGKHGVEGTGADAWAPALTLGVPVGLARLYAKGGVAFGEFEGTSIREEYKSEDPFYGAGLRIGMNQGLGFRLEYERYQFDRADVDVAMAGLDLSFGRRD